MSTLFHWDILSLFSYCFCFILSHLNDDNGKENVLNLKLCRKCVFFVVAFYFLLSHNITEVSVELFFRSLLHLFFLVWNAWALTHFLLSWPHFS